MMVNQDKNATRTASTPVVVQPVINEQEVARKKIMNLFDSPVVPIVYKPPQSYFAPVPLLSYQ